MAPGILGMVNDYQARPLRLRKSFVDLVQACVILNVVKG
jgi:hypothetical protein